MITHRVESATRYLQAHYMSLSKGPILTATNVAVKMGPTDTKTRQCGHGDQT